MIRSLTESLHIGDNDPAIEDPPSPDDGHDELPPEREDMRPDWHDPDHSELRISLIDSDGKFIYGQRFPAPINADTAHAVKIRVEVAHEDGCTKPLMEVPIPAYSH